MSEVHRYQVVTMLSVAGATIGYDPHGPDVVMAAEFDRVTAERDALQQRLTAADEELDQCQSMARMIEEKEWAEHVGTGPISSQVESAFTQLHNELSEARQGLTAADERAVVLKGLLREVEAVCDLAMSAIDDDERGANFVQIIAAIKAKAALKPAESAKCERCGCSTVETCDDLGCGYLGAGNGAPE